MFSLPQTPALTAASLNPRAIVNDGNNIVNLCAPSSPSRFKLCLPPLQTDPSSPCTFTRACGQIRITPQMRRRNRHGFSLPKTRRPQVFTLRPSGCNHYCKINSPVRSSSSHNDAMRRRQNPASNVRSYTCLWSFHLSRFLVSPDITHRNPQEYRRRIAPASRQSVTRHRPISWRWIDSQPHQSPCRRCHASPSARCRCPKDTASRNHSPGRD